MRTPTFEIKSQTHFFFGWFCRKFCHADVDSRDEQQAILLKKKKVKNIRPKLRFSCVFPAKKLARFCHAVLDFCEHQGLPPD
jgi:hypothetical protein